MALQEAYGQTDVMNDPQYLTTVAQGHGRQARFARQRLQDLQQQRQFQASHDQQAQQFAAGQAQQERLRRDALAAREQAHEENLGQRQVQQQQIEAYRQAQLSQTEEGRRQQRALGILNLAQSNLETTYGAKAPAIRKALYDQFYNMTQGGSQPAQTPAPAAQTPAPAAGGAPAASGLSGLAPQTVDPKVAAVAKFQAGQGETVTQPAQGTQPQTQPTAGGTPQTNFAPGDLVNTQDANTGVRKVVPSSQAYDLNMNTGEYVPHNMEGTINGQPASLALAEGAIKTGVNPIYSPKAMSLLDNMKAQQQEQKIGEATTPPMDIPIPEPPKVGGNQPHTAMNFGDITTTQPQTAAQQPQAPTGPAPAPASTNVGDVGSGQVQPPVAPTGPQRPFVPADYIANFLNKGFASQTDEMKRQQAAGRY